MQKNAPFNVFAVYVSAISRAEVKFQLVPRYDGFCFQNVDTLSYEHGTFVHASENKFNALSKFSEIFAEMKPTFLLETVKTIDL